MRGQRDVEANHHDDHDQRGNRAYSDGSLDHHRSDDRAAQPERLALPATYRLTGTTIKSRGRALTGSAPSEPTTTMSSMRAPQRPGK